MEAAKVEGANRVPGSSVTSPYRNSSHAVLRVVMTIIVVVLQFDYIWCDDGHLPNPREILSTWMYKNAFVSYRAGYANMPFA